MVLFVASDWGWKADERCNWTLASLNNLRQKLLVKTGSWSLTTELGTPCKRTMVSKKAHVTDVAIYG
jgi:hypothetical protein